MYWVRADHSKVPSLRTETRRAETCRETDCPFSKYRLQLYLCAGRPQGQGAAAQPACKSHLQAPRWQDDCRGLLKTTDERAQDFRRPGALWESLARRRA